MARRTTTKGQRKQSTQMLPFHFLVPSSTMHSHCARSNFSIPQSSPPPPPAVYSLRLLFLRILPWPAGPDAALTPYQVATEIPYSLNWSMAFLSATHLLVVS